jgi:hypothetical protein
MTRTFNFYLNPKECSSRRIDVRKLYGEQGARSSGRFSIFGIRVANTEVDTMSLGKTSWRRWKSGRHHGHSSTYDQDYGMEFLCVGASRRFRLVYPVKEEFMNKYFALWETNDEFNKIVKKLGKALEAQQSPHTPYNVRVVVWKDLIRQHMAPYLDTEELQLA